MEPTPKPKPLIHNKSMDTQTPILTEPEPVTPIRIQPPQSTNGMVKRQPRIYIHHHHHPVVVTYNECLKNHAAPNGRHSIDGCGEFLPSNSELLFCDVCGCHRNYHRREEEYYISLPLALRNQHMQGPPPTSSSAPPIVMNPNPNNVGVSRKRFRTKFTQDQKGKMLELAERVGWKMQKRDEVVINESCKEIGVEKGVFKVWMHNNKNTIGGKKETSDNSIAVAATQPIMVTGNLGNGVKNQGNGDRGKEKEQEQNVVVDNNDGSSPSDLMV